MPLLGVLACSTPGAELSESDDIQRNDIRRNDIERDYTWDLPLGFTIPHVPEDNPMSSAKVELGRFLFYESRLSITGDYSCASCHQQARAFTDGRPTARGATGAAHPRGAMSLTNVAYNTRYGWGDSKLTSLEAQARVPLLNETPIEIGLAGRTEEVLTALASDVLYRARFAMAFPGESEPITLDNLIRAIASFERTLVSGRSAYDRLLFLDERSALEEKALRGMRLFFSERTRCSQCHRGLNFSGLSEGGHAPTLRNIAVTAPYMRDGSITTLERVIDRYAQGGPFPNRPGGAAMRGFAISRSERRDLVAFLEGLTDTHFLKDPRFADPSAR